MKGKHNAEINVSCASTKRYYLTMNGSLTCIDKTCFRPERRRKHITISTKSRTHKEQSEQKQDAEKMMHGNDIAFNEFVLLCKQCAQ